MTSSGIQFPKEPLKGPDKAAGMAIMSAEEYLRALEDTKALPKKVSRIISDRLNSMLGPNSPPLTNDS